MDIQNKKCVMIIDENLPSGIIANTAAVMGITLGKRIPEIVGRDVTDKNGYSHLGITEFPVPILKGSIDLIKEIRERLFKQEYEEIIVVDFSDVAQSCKNYDDFIDKIANVSENDLQYLGIGIFGNKKQINKLTGSMPLLR